METVGSELFFSLGEGELFARAAVWVLDICEPAFGHFLQRGV